MFALALTSALLCSAPATDISPTDNPPALESEAPKSAWRLGGGYYGDIVSHPGGYVGFSWTAARAGVFGFSLGADLGAYHHVRNHSALFARANFATRVTFRSGVLLEPRFVIGYGHTWVAGDDHFMVDDQGMLRQATPAGDANLVYGVGVAFGYEVQRGPARGLAILVRPEILGRYPYNDFALTQFALLAGFEWNFGNRSRS